MTICTVSQGPAKAACGWDLERLDWHQGWRQPPQAAALIPVTAVQQSSSRNAISPAQHLAQDSAQQKLSVLLWQKLNKAKMLSWHEQGQLGCCSM